MSQEDTQQTPYEVQREHEELRHQHGDQAGALTEHWLSKTNFPPLPGASSSERALQSNGLWSVIAAKPVATETWCSAFRAAVRPSFSVASTTSAATTSAAKPSATTMCGATENSNRKLDMPVSGVQVNSKELKAAVSTTLQPTALISEVVARTEMLTSCVGSKAAKRRLARAPALVGGVWMRNEVKKDCSTDTSLPLTNTMYNAACNSEAVECFDKVQQQNTLLPGKQCGTAQRTLRAQPTKKDEKDHVASRSEVGECCKRAQPPNFVLHREQCAIQMRSSAQAPKKR